MKITSVIVFFFIAIAAAVAAVSGSAQDDGGNSQRALLLDIGNQLLGPTGNRSACLSSWTANNTVCKHFTGIQCNSNYEVITLALPGCHLRGVLPAALSQLAKLQYLLLCANDIASSLPPEYGALSELQVMLLYNNRLGGPLPPGWSAMRALQSMDLSCNLLQGALPETWAELTSNFSELNLRNNSLVSAVPQSWTALTSLYWLDLSLNCISLDDATLTTLLNNSGMGYLDLTPTCLHMPPLTTPIPLAAPYTFRAVNSWTQPSLYYWSGCYYSTNNNISFSSLQQVAFGRYQLLFSPGDIDYLNYASSCVTAQYIAKIECVHGDDDAGMTKICNSSLLPVPPWDGKTVLAQASLTGTIFFDAAENGEYLHGANYRVHFRVGFNVPLADASLGIRKYQEINISTPFFVAHRCKTNSATEQRGLMAVPLSTSCAPCPALHSVGEAASDTAEYFAQCDGSTVARVGTRPAWRIRDDVLPLYECPREKTHGCYDSASSSSSSSLSPNATANVSSGASCKPSYEGPLCTRCAVGYSMSSDGECGVCPSNGTLVLLFSLSVALLALLVALYVFVSLKPRRMVDDNDNNNHNNNLDDDGEKKSKCRCCASCASCSSCSEMSRSSSCAFVAAAKAKLTAMKPTLSRIIVVVRQLINHWSLVGALRGTVAVSASTGALRTLLGLQEGANTFAFGSVASTLQCVMSHEWSKVVLNFNTIWIVFGCVFLAESILFFVWTRRATVAATVALFLSFVAYSPLVGYAAKLLSLCHEMTFFRTSDYLLRSRSPSSALFTVRLLGSDWSQECTDDFNKHYLVAGWLTVVFFALGLPLLVGVVYRLLLSKQPELRDEIFSFFTKKYRKSVWYYELVLLVRKLCVALIVGVLPGRDQLQLQLFTVVCAVMLALSCALQPLEVAVYNRTEQLSVASAILCAAALSLMSTFAGNDGVLIASTVLVFISQIAANVTIVWVFARSDVGLAPTASATSASKTAQDGEEEGGAALWLLQLTDVERSEMDTVSAIENRDADDHDDDDDDDEASRRTASLHYGAVKSTTTTTTTTRAAAEKENEKTVALLRGELEKTRSELIQQRAAREQAEKQKAQIEQAQSALADQLQRERDERQRLEQRLLEETTSRDKSNER